jgi:hypothetical protein
MYVMYTMYVISQGDEGALARGGGGAAGGRAHAERGPPFRGQEEALPAVRTECSLGAVLCSSV